MAHNTPDSPESQVIVKHIIHAAKEVRTFNPETYITADNPALLSSRYCTAAGKLL
jgi:hypothetical protein